MPLSQDISGAAEVLRRGGLVAFPTETVYGLGADAENSAAVARVFSVKGRPPSHPLIVHLASPSELGAWAARVPQWAELLAELFWPGPLTLVLRRASRVPLTVTGGLDSVGLRVPAHPIAHKLLKEFGGGIAAPSANRFSQVSPTTAAHVAADLGADVDVILDGGACSVGIESTIMDATGEQPMLLRPGGLSREHIEAALRKPVLLPAAPHVRAPGQHALHYAPRAQVRIIEAADLEERCAELEASRQNVAVLAPASHLGARGLPSGAQVHVRSLGETEFELGQRLYADLREFDALGCQVVLVILPEERGLGLAVADRLRRAAGPRIKGPE